MKLLKTWLVLLTVTILLLSLLACSTTESVSVKIPEYPYLSLDVPEFPDFSDNDIRKGEDNEVIISLDLWLKIVNYSMQVDDLYAVYMQWRAYQDAAYQKNNWMH